MNLEAATAAAVKAILVARERFRGWVEEIRPREGPMGRFHWAVSHTRDASIPSTGYALGAIVMMGLFDEVITDRDRREGTDWIMSHYAGDGQFRDPALLDRVSPDWPRDKPWPSPAMLESANGYASLIKYGAEDIPLRRPAKGLLQSEGWEDMLEFTHGAGPDCPSMSGSTEPTSCSVSCAARSTCRFPMPTNCSTAASSTSIDLTTTSTWTRAASGMPSWS